MNFENIYQTVCAGTDPQAALGRLGDAALAGLVNHLEAAGAARGVPGLVLALCEAEAVRRFVAANLNNHSPVGEG